MNQKVQYEWSNLKVLHKPISTNTNLIQCKKILFEPKKTLIFSMYVVE